MIEFFLKDQLYKVNNSVIETICLFGSFARGEQDGYSDIDLFIMIDDCEEQDFLKIKQDLVLQLGLPSSWVSVYRKSTIFHMKENGSYFLWHLKLEGKILYSKTGLLERVLQELPSYNKAREDLFEYLEICSDVRCSIKTDMSTAWYELSVLASLARNTCIALAHICGIHVFGRTTPIEICGQILREEMPFSLDDYLTLYQYRMAYTRNTEFVLHQPSEQLVNEWVGRIEKLINTSLRILNEGGVNCDESNGQGDQK